MPTGALCLVLRLVTGMAIWTGCSSQPPGRFAVTGTIAIDVPASAAGTEFLKSIEQLDTAR